MVTLRRALRWAATAMLASAGLVLLVALARVASNWRDDAPVATPAALTALVALAVGPAQPGSPLFFKLQGLLAPPGLTLEV